MRIASIHVSCSIITATATGHRDMTCYAQVQMVALTDMTVAYMDGMSTHIHVSQGRFLVRKRPLGRQSWKSTLL